MPVNESNTIQYTVTTSRVADGTTLYWKTTGNTTNSDIIGGNTGSITVTNNRAYINVTIVADESPDGTKTLGIDLLTGSLSGTTVVSTDPNTPIIINDTSTAPTVAPKLYVWGQNNYGHLGLNNTVYKSSPTQVGTDTNWASATGTYTSIVADENHSFGIKTDGTLWTWGRNNYGQLGTNDKVNRSSPVQVGTGTDWSKVSSGRLYTLAIKTDGTLWSWGYNGSGIFGSGQLAQNDKVDRSSPTQVGTGTNWKEVCASDNGACIATKTDGTLWTWGYNAFAGALGQNNLIERSSPVQVGTGTDWDKGYASQRWTIAVKTDGTLWHIGGSNYLGVNGLNTNNTYRSSPTQIGSSTTWTNKIAIGYYCVTAIKSDGTLWSWGANESGQSGINNAINRSSPVQVGTNTNWSQIAGNLHGFASIKTSGTLWSWGYNADGALGQNDVIDRSSPTQIGSNTNWNKVDASRNSFMVITTN